MIERSCAEKKPLSVGLLGNAADIFPELAAPRRPARRRHRPDLARTIRSTATCPRAGRSPSGRPGAQPIPRRSMHAAKRSMAEHVRAMLEFHRRGIPTVDYGNNIRQMAKDEGVADAFDFPGFVPAYIRPLFCRGIGPFRWAALSGDPEDIYRTDAKVKELMPDDAHLHNWLDMAQGAHPLPGPARAHLLGRPRRPPPARPRLQRDGGEGRAEGADRHRPRSPRLRLGRLAPTARPRP